MDLQQEPILVINIRGIDHDDWHPRPGFIGGPLLPVFLEHRPLMLAKAITLEAGHGPQQPGMQAQSIGHAGRHMLILAVLGRMAGVFDLVPIDRPDRHIAQLRESAEPVSSRQLPLKPAITGGGHLGEKFQSSTGLKRIKPSAFRHRHDSRLIGE